MEQQQFSELLYLQTPCAALTVKGVLPAFNSRDGKLNVDCERVLLLRAAGQELENTASVPPLFVRNQLYEILAEPVGPHRISVQSEDFTLTPAGQSGLLSGLACFDGIGMTELSVLVDGKPYLKLEFEVFPDRACCREDYEALCADAASELCTLAEEVLNKTVYTADGMQERFLETVHMYYPPEQPEALYRFWCFLKMGSFLLPHYRLTAQNVIAVNDSKLEIARTEECFRIAYEDAENEEAVTMEYCPSAAAEYAIRIHLDKRDSTFLFLPRYQAVEETDINALYPLWEELAQQHGVCAADGASCGAYLLFPAEIGGIERETVGALPFLPGHTEAVTDFLEGRITPAAGIVLDTPVLPRAIEKQLAQADWASREVLVGCFRNRDQFETCLDSCFYYIPYEQLEDAGKSVRCVALLQTPRFFGTNAGVQYYGEVTKATLVMRKTIREVPMRSTTTPETLYYKYTVREWQKLTRPILMREEGFISAVTTRFLLMNTRELPELLLQSEEEYRLYQELRRRTDAPAINTEQISSGFQIGVWKVLLRSGWIQAIHGTDDPKECRIEEFVHAPFAAFKKLFREEE